MVIDKKAIENIEILFFPSYIFFIKIIGTTVVTSFVNNPINIFLVNPDIILYYVSSLKTYVYW